MKTVIVLTAPASTYFATVNFSSYGTPTGTSPNFVIGSCNSAKQVSGRNRLLSNGTTSIPATNAVFGDPCGGTFKRYVLASYAEPLCSGSTATVTGSVPLVVLVLIRIYGVSTTSNNWIRSCSRNE
jgi:hypothetical protein